MYKNIAWKSLVIWTVAVVESIINVGWALSDAGNRLGLVRMGLHIVLAIGSAVQTAWGIDIWRYTKPSTLNRPSSHHHYERGL